MLDYFQHQTNFCDIGFPNQWISKFSRRLICILLLVLTSIDNNHDPPFLLLCSDSILTTPSSIQIVGAWDGEYGGADRISVENQEEVKAYVCWLVGMVDYGGLVMCDVGGVRGDVHTDE
ncbi:unnamed protein product [Lactuca saligna]|uniref:Uncharacterized protein n=1 Tax=Lactuca saligna TaxID=75948 RepID=A0AA36EER6_LACSI|nr:unnamed protein product [Lactuca saligna]